jgi:hypothetical protein
MTLPKKYEKELDKIWMELDEALTTSIDSARRGALLSAMKRVEKLKKSIVSAAANMGRLGGQTTAERMKAQDPDYYKKIAAKRKTFGGGRPKRASD